MKLEEATIFFLYGQKELSSGNFWIGCLPICVNLSATDLASDSSPETSVVSSVSSVYFVSLAYV